jgi:hypothetical protein
MTKKSLTPFMILLASSCISSSAFAAKQSGSKMTCQDFLSLDEVSRPRAVYWADGYGWGGQQDAYLDFDRENELVPTVVEECTKNPTHKFVSKVKAVSKKKATS